MYDYYDYGYGSQGDVLGFDDVFGNVLGLLTGYFAFLFIVCVGLYVFNGIFYSKLYKAKGGSYAQKSWWAWVPVLNTLIKGEFLQEEAVLPSYCKWILGLYPFVNIIPGLGQLAFLAGSVFVYIAEFKFLSNRRATALPYVMLFVFPLINPILWKGLLVNPPMVQPLQNQYAQPMQNQYAQPMQNQYAQPMQQDNPFAQQSMNNGMGMQQQMQGQVFNQAQGQGNPFSQGNPFGQQQSMQPMQVQQVQEQPYSQAGASQQQDYVNPFNQQ